MSTNFDCDVYMLSVLCNTSGEGMGVGRCGRWGVSHRVFVLVCGASVARAHRGSRSGGNSCFLDRERKGRVGEACLL